jgi:hypothetical protein
MFLLIAAGRAWGPILHQVIAQQFSLAYFPYITDHQRRSYVLGSIYADGLDKSITHCTSCIVEKLREAGDPDSNIYWFLLGTFSHIPPDTFAHAGKPPSFITPFGLVHHFSELVVDSLMAHLHSTSFLRISAELRDAVTALNVSFSKVFTFLYPIVYVLAKFPFHWLLPRVERDRCPKRNLSLAVCNFMKHYDAMLQSMQEAMPRVYDRDFTDATVTEISTRLVYEIECCQSQPIFIGLSDAEQTARPFLVGVVS